MTKYFKCFTDKNPVSYKLGEEIIFTVFAREDGKNINCESLKWELRADDGGSMKGTATITEQNPLVVKYTLKRAGFVHLNCEAVLENGEKDESFEPLDSSAGANVLDLTYSDNLPEDFGEYWDGIEKIVADFETEVVYLKEAEGQEGYRAYEVRIKTPSGRPASGYVTIPLKSGKYPIRISFLGYGLHAASYVYKENMICGCFNAHGFENDAWDQIEKKYGQELKFYGFNNEENASNMTTYFRNMMIRNLIALKYLKSLPEWNKKDVISSGGSQGALQAITVAAHDKDVTEVYADRPWLCDLNSSNKGYIRGWRPDFAEGLRYFDTVAQGMHLECPITIMCHLGDYTCPPKTVMTLYNSVKTEKKISFIQSARHSYFPPEDEAVNPDF